jgi:hypothetical protein
MQTDSKPAFATQRKVTNSYRQIEEAEIPSDSNAIAQASETERLRQQKITKTKHHSTHRDYCSDSQIILVDYKRHGAAQSLSPKS